jgi:hypothetical protein
MIKIIRQRYVNFCIIMAKAKPSNIEKNETSNAKIIVLIMILIPYVSKTDW